MLNNSVVRFALVGVVNTLAGLSVIYACKWLLGFQDIPANVCGYAVGLTVSFTLNKRWSFKHAGPAFPAMLRFIAVFAVAYAANLGSTLAFISRLDVNSYFAHALGVVPYTVLSYLGSRYIVFVKPSSAATRTPR